MAAAHSLDGAGTASLENPPVAPVAPSTTQSGGQGAGETAGTSGVSSGGVGIPGYPVIERITCLRQCVSATRPTRGGIIGIRGDNLDRVTRVIFRSREGRIRMKFRSRSRGVVRVAVPKRAIRGYVFVVDSGGNRSNRSPQELPVLPVSAIPVEVFPVKGSFDFGGAGSRFGASRSGHSHQGQDLSARCGTPLVSIRRARVVYNRWDNGGGHYIVLRNLGTNTHFVYMHMQRRSPLKVGQVVGAGAPIGRVGNTGRSSGCHLHFEYWIGPWQTGGRPIDPLPYLRSLLK